MSLRRWFLPHDPDILGVLIRQLAVTTEGMEAFERWAAATRRRRSSVRDCEHRADVVRRELHAALREAFVTPVEPEDLYALSRGSDEVLNQAKDAVRESEVMACRPDAPFVEMAGHLAEASRRLAERSRSSGATPTSRPRPPMLRSSATATSSMSTAWRWPRCSKPTICAR